MQTDRSNTSPAGTVSELRLTILSGSFTIGAAGAISASDSAKIAGATPTKTAAKTARYDLLTYRPWTRIVAFANIVGPADAAFGNTAANTVQCRNQAPTSTTSQVELQGILASSGADTDFASGTIINWQLHCYGK